MSALFSEKKSKNEIFSIISCILIIILGNSFIFNTRIQISKDIVPFTVAFLLTGILLKTVFLDCYLTSYPKMLLLIKMIDFLTLTFIIRISSLYLWVFGLLSIIFILYMYTFDNEKWVKIISLISLVWYVQLIFYNKLYMQDFYKYLIFFIPIIIISLGIILSKKLTLLKTQRFSSENAIKELKVKNDELNGQNAEMKYRINDLEIKIEKASKSLADLSTIQEVSKTINSTRDVKELFTVISDIIIGVMGVTYCTIFLKENSQQKVIIQTSNISNQTHLNALKEKIGVKIMDLMEKGHRVFGNVVDPFDYPYAIERNIQSTLFVPIINKNKILGLILAEHTIEKGISDESKKFIETIANQVGSAVENAMLYEEMESIVSRDPITRLYNREYFQSNLVKEIENAKEKHSLCLIMTKIDKFKLFNNTYGRDYGDAVLKSIAEVLKYQIGSEGIVARYQGDQFAVLIRNIGLEKGFKIAEEIRAAIEKNIVKYNNKAVSVTASFGITEYPKITTNYELLIQSAEDALKRAEDDGQNCVRKAIIQMNDNTNN